MSQGRPTDRQEQILRALRAHVAEHGEGPSVRRLGELVGLSSTGSVAYQLGRLERQGLISRSGHSWRTIRLGS